MGVESDAVGKILVGGLEFHINTHVRHCKGMELHSHPLVID